MVYISERDLIQFLSDSKAAGNVLRPIILWLSYLYFHLCFPEVLGPLLEKRWRLALRALRVYAAFGWKYLKKHKLG